MSSRDWMRAKALRGGLSVLLTRADRDLAAAAASLRTLGEPERAAEAERLSGEVRTLAGRRDGAADGGGR